jgi:hypothetical protein
VRTLTFEDVRVSARDRNLIIAAPVWAYEPGVRHRGKQRYRPIKAAWVLIYKTIAERGDPDPRPEWRRPGSKYYYATSRDCVDLPTLDMIHYCQVCGESFFGYGRTQTCSARCYRARRKQTHVYSKQPRKKYPREPVDHDWRPCEHCGYEFEPARKDARFCSGRCRVAHHRAQTKPPTPCE